MRSVLRLAPFRRLLAAYTLNELAWAFSLLALSYLVYRRTNSALGAAAHLDRGAGFRKVEEKPNRLWGADVVEEKYELVLGAPRTFPGSSPL